MPRGRAYITRDSLVVLEQGNLPSNVYGMPSASTHLLISHLIGERRAVLNGFDRLVAVATAELFFLSPPTFQTTARLARRLADDVAHRYGAGVD